MNTDAGGGQAKGGRRLLYSAQAAKKGYLSFVLTAKNPGGHSSLPTRENAIYELAAALLKVRDVQFPVHLNEVTREYTTGSLSSRRAPGNLLVPRHLQGDQVEKLHCGDERVDALRGELALLRQIKLVLADGFQIQLLGAAVEILGELRNIME